ncbi:hypothetical protein FOL47_000020 [Perkinsus chesapeaki]|uniref:Dynein regulatory complex protein 12 n=1 Tax=Perkinsus chesapeaki TaxID=330153 RepID=A0A7J6N5U4_PERCH|nr:hypothetical protein FOL47_000020 [Perkinsus chesapeaki]
MPPKKAPAKKDGGAEEKDYDLENYMLQKRLEVIRHRIQLKEEVIDQSKEKLEEQRKRKAELGVQSDRELERRREVVSEMTRQYNEMQNSFNERIADLKEQVKKAQEDIVEVENRREATRKEKEDEIAKKDASIRQLTHKMEAMAFEFADMLKEVLDKMSQRIEVTHAGWSRSDQTDGDGEAAPFMEQPLISRLQEFKLVQEEQDAEGPPRGSFTARPNPVDLEDRMACRLLQECLTKGFLRGLLNDIKQEAVDHRTILVDADAFKKITVIRLSQAPQFQSRTERYRTTTAYITRLLHILERLFWKLDRKGLGSISIEALSTSLVLLASPEVSRLEKVELLFQVFDTDEDNCLTSAEMKSLFLSAKVNNITRAPIDAFADHLLNDRLAIRDAELLFRATMKALTARQESKDERRLWKRDVEEEAIDTDQIVTLEDFKRVFESDRMLLRSFIPGPVSVNSVIEQYQAQQWSSVGADQTLLEQVEAKAKAAAVIKPKDVPRLKLPPIRSATSSSTPRTHTSVRSRTRPSSIATNPSTWRGLGQHAPVDGRTYAEDYKDAHEDVNDRSRQLHRGSSMGIAKIMAEVTTG